MQADNHNGLSRGRHGLLLRFLEKHADNYSKFLLLFFLARHPNTTFDFFGICCALEESKLELKEGLRVLVEEGLVEQTETHGVVWYRLTAEPGKRAQVLNLAELTWQQAQELAEFCAVHNFRPVHHFCKIAAPVK